MTVVRARFTAWFDGLGLALSSACAVHCAALPIAFALLPSLQLALLSLRDPQHRLAMSLLALSRFEAWTVAAAVSLSLGTSLAAWHRHREWTGLAAAVCGSALLVGALATSSPGLHTMFAIIGAIALCVSHWANLRARLTSMRR